MNILPRVYRPPFNITRISHITLTVPDLDACVDFYTKVVGLVVTERTSQEVYLRGVEEACHHSLVLIKDDNVVCRGIGFRVQTDSDLDSAYEYFTAMGAPVQFIEAPFQSRTLRVRDSSGTPIDLCASMPVQARKLVTFNEHQGAAALRLDHCQVIIPNIDKTYEFYNALGFMLTEYMYAGDGQPTGLFLQRKGNTHDYVLFRGAGPRIHHFAYTLSEPAAVFRAADMAGIHGYGARIDRGPSRHGPSHALFLYLRDPAGHRIELFTTHYLVMDAEIEPVAWDVTDRSLSVPWGFPAPSKWFEEATHFEGVPVEAIPGSAAPYSLERYLAEGNPETSPTGIPSKK